MNEAKLKKWSVARTNEPNWRAEARERRTNPVGRTKTGRNKRSQRGLTHALISPASTWTTLRFLYSFLPESSRFMMINKAWA